MTHIRNRPLIILHHHLRQKTEGVLRGLSEQIRSYAPPSDREKASESLTAQSADLHSSHAALEEEERGVIKQGERVRAAGVSHMEDVEAYNAEKERMYELSDKDRRCCLELIFFICQSLFHYCCFFFIKFSYYFRACLFYL